MSATARLGAIEMPKTERYVTRSELARLMGVSVKTVDRMVLEGMPSEVWGKRSRRFLTSECVAWASARTPRPPSVDGSGSRNDDKWDPVQQDYARILLRDPCAYCGAASEHIDHITARAYGGQHVWENFTGACKRCNSKKGAKSLALFLAWGRLA